MKELWKKATRKIEDNNKLVHIVEKIQEHNETNKEQTDTNVEIGFNYIIKRPTFAPICFGSKQQRVTFPLSGPSLSSYMARSVLEQFPKLAPNIYEIKGRDWSHEILNKKRSVKGLIGEEPRFRETFKNIAPPSSKYNLRVFPKKTKRNKVPFKQSSKRFSPPSITKNNPGPGSYDTCKKRKIPFIQTFGGSATLKPAIPIECVPVNVHVCEMCHLTPLIDFWHKNYTNFMCVQCYSEEYEEHSKYTTKQLREFKLMRDCSFMHDHQGTNTYITTLPAKYIKKKLLIETYLSQYLNEFIPQPIHDLPVQLINVSKPDIINFQDTTQFYTQFKQYLMRIATRKARKRSLLVQNNDVDSLMNFIK